MEAATAGAAAERLFALLREPFQAVDLEWRVMYSREPGNQHEAPLILVTPYVNRPALINRLNQVCGIDGWQTAARHQDGHVSVGVGVWIPPVITVGEGPMAELLATGRWVWRWDGTGPLDHDPKGKGLSRAEAGKGDFSNAFKRACEQLGCALYLRELKPLRAIVSRNGRYKAKIGTEVYRWDPPGLEGTPSYPGEIPGHDTAEGGSPSGNGQAEPENPPKASAPKKLTEEEGQARIKSHRVQLSAWMRENRYELYHLEAVLATHPKLRIRCGTPDELGRLGGVEEWDELMATTERRAPRWNDAPKELAKEFPTSPDRLQALEQLLDQVGHKVESSERILIEDAKKVGWSDGVEYWIEKLGERT